jgi:hypothetical protein
MTHPRSPRFFRPHMARYSDIEISIQVYSFSAPKESTACFDVTRLPAGLDFTRHGLSESVRTAACLPGFSAGDFANLRPVVGPVPLGLSE